MSNTPICPCDEVVHPVEIFNQPGLDRVSYRAGQFRSFRRALLQPLPDERVLRDWRPMPRGDLALQIVEWWAYIADVLTLYAEHSINANLLRTARHQADVRGLVRILGYRPRPALAANVVVAALLGGRRPIELLAGFPIQSSPAPGKQPQTFETSTPVMVSLPDAVPASPRGQLAKATGELYLEGTIKAIRPGDLVVVAPRASFDGALLVSVQAVNHRSDSAGRPFTEVVPNATPALPAGDAADFRLLRSARTTGVWKYSTTVNVVTTPLEIEGVDRGLGAGQILVMTAPGSALAPAILKLTGTTEEIWYANGNASSPPASSPVGLPHTRAAWTSEGSVNTPSWDAEKNRIVLLVDWQPAGVLRNVPIDAVSGETLTLVAEKGHMFRIGSQSRVLIEDAVGNGVVATATVADSKPSELQVTSFAVTPSPTLTTPLRVLHNVVDLTRGKTVAREVLGIGDASIPNQEFVLQKSPLTYLPAGDSYRSSLALYVDGIQWTEVASFYHQPANAHVYITFEDDEQKTHVRGGDGVNGAPFPTGATIVAEYRTEAGQDVPAAGTLTTIVRPLPGLRGVRSPVAAGGGADPDPPEQIRQFAPRSVLTFGRAISAGDYEAIAAGAPSVARVRAYYAWNAGEQRAAVTLYVGDTAAAVASTKSALARAADPNRAVAVLQASRVHATLLIAIRIQPGRIADDVVAAVRLALADPDRGVFGERRTGIGESIYFSQISAACEKTPGVEAVTGALLFLSRPDPVTGLTWGIPPRVNVTAGEFVVVAPDAVVIFPEVMTGA